jgi:hypothetical protein
MTVNPKVAALIGATCLLAVAMLGRAAAQQSGWSPAAGNRYQYKCITKAPDRIWVPEATTMLNAEGGQGWRLMENRFIFPNGYSDVYCFERRY